MFGIWVQTVQALWRRKGLILAVTAVVLLGSAVTASFAGRTYQAQRYLIVSEFDLRDAPDKNDLVGLASVLPEPLSPQVYATVLVSPNLIGGVLDDLVKAGAFEDGDAPELVDFVSTLRVKVDQVDPTARPIRYSPAVMISATAHTPELARTIVEMWTKHAVEFVRKLRGVHLEAARGVLDEEEKRTDSELTRLQGELAQEKALWNAELLMSEIADRQKEIARLETELNTLSQELALSEQSAAALRETLAKESPTIKLFRAPSNDAYFIVTQQDGAKTDSVEKAGMIDEVVNQVYNSISGEEKLTQSKATGTRASIEDLGQRLSALRAAQDKQKGDLAVHEEVQDRLTRDIAILQSAYKQAASAADMVQVADLLATSDASGTTPLGLGFTDTPVYAVEQKPVVSRTVIVLFRTIVGFALVCAYVAAIDVGLPSIKKAMTPAAV